MTAGEIKAKLDGELDESLSGFDQELGEEQGELGERRKETEEIVGSRTDPVSSSGSYGSETGSSSHDGEQGTEQAGEVGDSGGSQFEGDESQTAQGKTDSGRRPGGSRGAPAPAEIPDGHDDDIVARQLREAAENEEDPELSAKLWEEYLNYKRGGKPPKKSRGDDNKDKDPVPESDDAEPSDESQEGDNGAGAKDGEDSDA